MTERQRELAFGLVRASLSAKGLRQTRDIMRLNQTLGELNDNNFDEYGEWQYHITVMGEPSASEPWGWQLDGHHAARRERLRQGSAAQHYQQHPHSTGGL